ncbi:MAG: hypothetical protein AAFR61_19170 [Bacteroidota bacterium]
MNVTSLFTALLLSLSGLSLFGQNPNIRQIDPQTQSIRMQVDGFDRQFIIHLPPAYQSQPQATFPVVFMFHGGGGTGQKFFNISHWKETGDREGFITVFPTALKKCLNKSDGPSRKNYWMTTEKLNILCPGETPHDDVRFVREMLAYLQSNLRVNSQKIYASGFSNGMGFILSKLLVEMSDTFAAFGGAGSLLQTSAGPINDAAPLFVMLGEKDDRFTVHAGVASLPATEAALEANVFMKSAQEVLLEMEQLATTYQVRERPRYLQYRFPTPVGSGAPEMRFAVLKGIGHAFPSGKPQHNGIIAADVLWNFFNAY